MTHFSDYHAKKCSLSKSTIHVDLTGTLRSSASALPLLPGCSAPKLPACSPSAPGSPDQIIYSSSPSRKRLEQSVCTHTQIQDFTHGFVVQDYLRWMTVGGDEPLQEALPQWPALLSAAFYRPGPAPPTPTHTGSSHVSCTLPLWFTHREKRLKFSIMHLMLDIILTSEFLPHCIGVEKIFFQLVSIVFLFFQNVIYWCGISASCIQEDRQIL